MDVPGEPLRELALFAGAGGGLLGSILNGWRTVCAVEIDDYCRRVLLQRQRDGVLDKFPIWDDVRTFDGRPWRGCVDIVSGGFPCQDISAAGKGAGIDGERSGLWGEMARIIGEVRPRFAFVENSPMLTVRGLGRVLGDLAEMGFDARWGVFSACAEGAPHSRERLFCLAYTCCNYRGGRNRLPNKTGFNAWKATQGKSQWKDMERWLESFVPYCNQAKDASGMPRVDDGLAARVDRLKASGNGQVPAVVRTAWQLLTR